MKFSVKDFFSKCDQIRSFLQIWAHLLKKSLMENVIFYAVYITFFNFSLLSSHYVTITEKLELCLLTILLILKFGHIKF